jgi:4-amino-4-deoxy-L-arabinose transferase-like glycosyltransferase
MTLTVLLVIFLIALSLRLTVVWSSGIPPEKDALQYHQIALNQLAGYGHAIEPGKPTTMRPPVYPLFIAGVYALTGSDYRHALYAQALLHSLLVFPLFWLGFWMSERISVGILSAGLFSVHTSFEIVSRLCRENITVILVVLFLWSVYEGCRKPRVGKFAVAGLLAGLLGLTNPVFMPLGVALFLVSLLWPKSRKFAKLLFIQALISMLIITPWLIRNQMVPDRGQEKHINRTLLYGYYPAFTDKWWWPVTDMVALEKEREKARGFFDNRGQGRDLTSELRSKILSHPLGAVKLAISRILIYWVSPPVGTSFIKSHSAALALITLFLQYIFVIIAIVSMILKLPHNKELFVFLVITLYLSIAYGFTHSIRRYGYPMAPQICLFFSWGCSDIISWIRNQMKKPHILNISRLY